MNANQIFSETQNQILDEMGKLGEKIKKLLIAKSRSIIAEQNKNSFSKSSMNIDGTVQRIKDKVIVSIFAGSGYKVNSSKAAPTFSPNNPINNWTKVSGSVTSGKTIRKAGSIKPGKNTLGANSISGNVMSQTERNGIKIVRWFDLVLAQSEPEINKIINQLQV